MSKSTKRDAIIDRLLELIQKERFRQKLSLKEVASRSGLDHTMVMRVEKRERLPTIDTLLRISEALDIRLSKLIASAERSAKRTKR